MGGDYFFDQAQLAQREGRWRDAIMILEEGDRQKCGMCMWWLADCYRHGYWGKSYSFPIYVMFKHKAIRYGNLRATVDEGPDNSFNASFNHVNDPYVFGMCHLYGRFQFDWDFKKAKQYLEKCKDSFAKRHLVYTSRNDDEWLRRRREAAAEGNPIDQCLLAQNLEREKLIEETVYWYRKAADQEYIYAQRTLYRVFTVVCYNPAAALYWHKRLNLPRLHDENEQVFEAIEKCQRACFQLILIRKYRQSVLSRVAKDVIIIISKMIWQTREEDRWKIRRSDRLKNKKRIKCF
jgi:TPR repeat protein